MRPAARRRRSAAGFTIVEVLTATLLTATGIAATFGVFGASHRASLISQRQELAVQQAQAAMAQLQLLDYATLAMTSAPAYSADSDDPRNRLSTDGQQLTVRSGFQEPIVIDAAGTVSPDPQTFTAGSGGAQITGKVYRFVTWRDEDCTNCTGGATGTEDTKRLNVAVTIDSTATLSQRKPIWISSIAADPTAAAPGNQADDPDTGPPTGAQNFYLYDTQCAGTSQQSRSDITGNHATRDTASWGTPSITANYSTCENTNLTKRPDLMGTAPPPGNSSTPLYRYSDADGDNPGDVTGSYPGGLAMLRVGSSCPTFYDSDDSGSTSVPSRYNVHAWSSNLFTSSFSLDGRIAVHLYTQSLGGVAGKGTICATVLKRTVTNSVPTDEVIGSTEYTSDAWPTTPTPVTFTWDLSSADSVPIGSRLVFVLSVKGGSETDNDLVMLYDHPSYASFLQIETTTPLP